MSPLIFSFPLMNAICGFIFPETMFMKSGAAQVTVHFALPVEPGNAALQTRAVEAEDTTILVHAGQRLEVLLLEAGVDLAAVKTQERGDQVTGEGEREKDEGGDTEGHGVDRETRRQLRG